MHLILYYTVFISLKTYTEPQIAPDEQLEPRMAATEIQDHLPLYQLKYMKTRRVNHLDVGREKSDRGSSLGM